MWHPGAINTFVATIITVASAGKANLAGQAVSSLA